MTNWEINLQCASKVCEKHMPSEEQFIRWVKSTALKQDQAEVTIRIVDEQESRHLNFQYRHQNKATNVLSFPFEVPMEIDLPLLGDLVLCAPVVIKEAQEQAKDLEAHWAHMVLHGILHLQGFDHQNNQQALQMESLEIRLLAALGFGNPYNLAELNQTSVSKTDN